MRIWRFFSAVLMAVSVVCLVSKVQGQTANLLTELDDHHVAELNSNQPYMAGFQVIDRNLSRYGTVDAVSVTVSFLSTDSHQFPEDSWLGAGLFVQGQDTVYRNVDYGFYMMLVLDDSGSLFLDVGLHQTRESTAPLQAATSELIYAYTWQISGHAPSEDFTLSMWLDSDGFANYQVTTSANTITLPAVNVISFPICKNIIRDVYAGNVYVGQFPFSRYVSYFLFGVVSSEPIHNENWKVQLRMPQFERGTDWIPVEEAWTIGGDAAYLDFDSKWGGRLYQGVTADAFPYEVVFRYSGVTLPSGTVLWNQKLINNAASSDWSPNLQLIVISVISLICLQSCGFAIWRCMRKRTLK